MSESGGIKEAYGVTMLSMLFCSNGGIITPIDSGQGIRMCYSYDDILADIEKGLYTWEDFYYLAATIAGEANTYEGMVAVVFEILNRCKKQGKSIKDIVTELGQYTGFNSSRVGVMPDDMVTGAILAALRGEVDNPIGDITNHFGRESGYDLWCEGSACTDVIVIGEGPYRNVFYEPYGAGHNKQTVKTDDAIIIYDNTKNEWIYDGVVIRREYE